MRPLHSTITPGVVHRQARTLLQGVFDWTPVGRSVAVTDLLDVLLLMAASTASLFAVVRRVFPFSHETASRAVDQSGRCPAAGPGTAPGPPDRPRSPAATGGGGGCWPSTPTTSRTTAGARRSWWAARNGRAPSGSSATPRPCCSSGSPLHRRRVSVGPQDQAARIVRTLWQQIAAHGLKVRGVVLDSAFSTAAQPCSCCRSTASPTRCRCNARAPPATPATVCLKDGTGKSAGPSGSSTQRQCGRARRLEGSPPDDGVGLRRLDCPAGSHAHRHAARQKQLSTAHRHRNQATGERTRRRR